jgi:hypothetical protein
MVVAPEFDLFFALSKYTTLNIQQQIQSSNFVAFAFEKISGHSQSFHQTDKIKRENYVHSCEAQIFQVQISQ